MSKPTIFAFNDLLNGADGALDSIDGAILVDKDLAVGVDINNFYPYQLDDDSGAAENSPLVISPDANAGTKRWLLKEGVFAGLTLYGNIVMSDNSTIGQAAGPLIKFNDTNNRLSIMGCDTGIGTLTPNDILHIKRTKDNTILAVIIENLGTAGATGAGFVGKSDAGTAQFFAGASSSIDTLKSRGILYTSDLDGIGIISYKAGSDIRLYTSGQTDAQERVRISGGGGFYLKELAAADGDITAFGQIWVKNTTPNQLWFTRDDGTDVQIA